MASQFALLFLRRLQVPVLITDLDQSRVDKGLAHINEEIDKLEAKGRLDGDGANKLRGLLHGTTDKSEYADCDFVIEAVFEEVGVKQQVFAEIEPIIAEDAILATNTSSLSVEEIGAKLSRPGAARRLPLLQPGRGHAAHRDREDADDQRGRPLHGVRRGQGAGQERGAHGRCARASS